MAQNTIINKKKNNMTERTGQLISTGKSKENDKPKQKSQNIINRRLAGINWTNSNVPQLQDTSFSSSAADVLNSSQSNENIQKNNNSVILQDQMEDLTISSVTAVIGRMVDKDDDVLKSNNKIQSGEKRKKKNKKKKKPVCGTGQLTNCLAIDCEMVGVGHMGFEHMLARVSIVNQLGDVILDKFVLPYQKVIDYRTAVSGIRPSDIANGENFHKVQKEVADIIKDRIIIGHSLSHDFKVLHLTHPKSLIRDTSKYKRLKRFVGCRSSPSLKSLAKIILGIEIQTGEHNSVEDAQTVMKIYLQFAEEWENPPHLYN